MFAGIARFILVDLSPFSSKYYLIPVAMHPVIKSFIVTFLVFAAVLTSLNNISEEVAASLTPLSFLPPPG